MILEYQEAGVTNILGDDYLHECYESMHSRVDKSTVNVKLIASCCGHMSFKRKDEQYPCCKRSRVIGRSDSLSPLEILIKCLRQVASESINVCVVSTKAGNECGSQFMESKLKTDI